jgi:tripartite-type tricarboxylate transporter receptor subunit TctC
MRRTILVLSALLLAAGAAQAQDKYPSKPVRVMVPFAAGSATDITIRIVGEQMRQQTGQGFLVENKPGVFGILAIEEMAKPPYDGYTLQVGNPGINILTPLAAAAAWNKEEAAHWKKLTETVKIDKAE